MIFARILETVYNNQYVTEANKKKKEEDDKDEYTMDDVEDTTDEEEEEDNRDEYTMDGIDSEGDDTEAGEDNGDEEEPVDNNDDEYIMDGIDSEADTDEDIPEDDAVTGEEDNEDEYTMDDTTDGGDTTDSATDDGGESGDMDDDGEIENALVAKEKELFANLSQEEMAIKERELKDCYLQLYDAIDDIISKVKRIPPQNQTQNVIDFINKKLNETSVEVKNYMCNTFANKTYFQNISQYNFYILILKNIEKLFNEIIVKTK